MQLLKSLTLTAGFLSLTIPAFTNTINLSTGYNGGGTLICPAGSTTCSGNDANWNVVDYGSSFLNTPTASQPAQVVNSGDADWYGGWVGNASETTTPLSDWIAYNPNNAYDNGDGVYTVTFNLTGYNLSTVSISGYWALDDSGILFLNGKQIGSLFDGWNPMTAFSDSTSTDFVQGVNTLRIEINNTDDFLEGVNLSGTLTGTLGTSPVPEPSHVAIMLGAGFLLLVFARRRALV